MMFRSFARQQLDGDTGSSCVAPCAYIFGAGCLSELLAIGLTTLLNSPMVPPSLCGFCAATLATGEYYAAYAQAADDVLSPFIRFISSF